MEEEYKAYSEKIENQMNEIWFFLNRCIKIMRSWRNIVLAFLIILGRM